MAPTLLAAFAGASDSASHVVTFDQPSTPGKTIVAFVNSPALVSAPAGGWTWTREGLNATEFGWLILPAASHTVPLSSVTVPVSASRSPAMVFFEDYIDADTLAYTSFPNPSFGGGTAWGTGLHTFANDVGLAVFTTGFSGTLTGDAATYDNSYVELGDTGPSVTSFEQMRMWVASGGPMSNNGISATFSPALNGEGLMSFAGMVGYTSSAPPADTTPPALQSTTPAASATGVAVGTAVSATFDEALGGTPTIALSPSVAGNVSVNGATVTFTPTAPLANSTTYTATASGIQDATGNAASNSQWSFTTAAAAPAGPNPTVTENAQPGTGDTGYVPSVANGAVGYLGYAKQFSVNAGSTIDFAVDGVNAANIAIYRLGGYDFTVANQQYKRLVATVANTGTDQSGTTPTTVDTNALAMNWSTTASWAVPSDMASGMFVAAVRNAGGDCGAWIPFIVRNDSRDADIVVKVSDSTWGLAYNYFGDIGSEKTGASLYGSGGPGISGTRVNAVSYDRPIVTRGQVVNHWDQYELPTIQWLESNGFDVKYISSYDLDQQNTVDVLGAAKILIHVGHDEYWSQGMRDNALAFAQAGGHQVWLTANEVFWRVRWADAGRTMWCYKDTKQDRTDPVSWTGTWRDARWGGTAPEDELCGTFFRMNGDNEVTMTLAPGAHQSVPFWRDTAVSAGTGLSLPILGFEVDEVIPKTGGVILAQSDVVATGNYADDNGEFYDGSATFTWGINMFRPTAGNGVSVGFGSMDWVRFLSRAARDPANATNTSIRQSMANLLYDLGATAGTFDPEAEGLVEPTPMALSSYGLSDPPAPEEGTATGLKLSDGTKWWNIPISGVTDHALLENRTAADQHPITAITGLETDLASKLEVTDLVQGTNVTLDKTGNQVTINASGGGSSPTVENIPAGSTLTVFESGGAYPARPTARTDVTVVWVGSTDPVAVALDGVDAWDQI